MKCTAVVDRQEKVKHVASLEVRENTVERQKRGEGRHEDGRIPLDGVRGEGKPRGTEELALLTERLGAHHEPPRTPPLLHCWPTMSPPSRTFTK